MKKLIYTLIILPIILFSCGEDAGQTVETSNADSIQAEIKLLEEEVYGEKATRFNEGSALKLANAYVNYQAARPEDKKSGDYLFKAAEITMQLGDYRRSLAHFQQVYEEYPDFKHHPLALFYQASIYDDKLNDDEKAKEIYQQFIEKHPDHDFATDAQILMQNLGKSDEELLREFESRNQEPTNP